MRLSKFAIGVRDEWRRLALPETSGRVVIAVSGGADSLALWLVLDELRGAGRLDCALTVAHFNHCLRAESADDALWVEAMAARLSYACVTGAGEVRSRGGNLEQAARRARYEFLQGAAESVNADYLLTAHTLDDQAETVLLNLWQLTKKGLFGNYSYQFTLNGTH